jgi:hypothetical protein
MKKITNLSPLFIIAIIAIAISSCTSTKLPEAYQVNPEVLEAKGGKVAFNVNATIPEKSFHKKAIVEFSPYLKYDGQTKELKKFTLRGEKTEGEGTMISSKMGGSFTYAEEFAYEDNMNAAELYVSPKITKGKKVTVLDDIKIADGIIATYQGIIHDEKTSIAKSGYEYKTIIAKSLPVYYPVNKSNVSMSFSLNKKEETKEMNAIMDEFLMNGYVIDNIKIDAWASPEGEISFNDNLSNERAETATKYLEKKIKTINKKRAKELGVDVKELEQELKIEAKGNGEDWAGFVRDMKNSDIPDKSTILNVISSQNDVNAREQEIRNMTVIYKEIEDQILPSLRKANIIVNCLEPKRPDNEIARLATTYPDSLNYTELLHAATLTEDHQARLNIYKAGFTFTDRDWRTYNNAAAEAIELKDLSEASNLLTQAAKLSANNGKIENNLGVIACQQENYTQAETHFKNAKNLGEDESYNLGIISIQKGEYQQALTYFKGIDCNHNVALAQLLSGEMNDALNNLNCSPESPQTNYMLAIYAARTNNASLLYEHLKKAIEKDDSFKVKAKEDREFLTYFNEASFIALVK